jgi:hypothetical protein
LLGSGFLIMQQLDYNNWKAVFSTWCVLRSNLDFDFAEVSKRGLNMAVVKLETVQVTKVPL